MSASAELQDAVIAALLADATVAAAVLGRVYDEPPPASGRKFPNITIGGGDAGIEDLECITLRLESLQVDVWTRENGRKRPARELTDAVVNALHLQDLPLATHALAHLQVEAVRVMRDPDGITAHGVVTLAAEIEQR